MSVVLYNHDSSETALVKLLQIDRTVKVKRVM